jgi:predicted PurR-regulated permease PerM
MEENTVVIKNAFRVGLIGALGVGLAMLLMTMVTSLATILTYIGVAFFLSLGLDPAVKFLERRRFPQWAAIASVILLFVVVAGGAILAIVPALVEQTVAFIKSLPAVAQQLLHEPWVIWLQTTFGNSVDLTKMLDSLVKFLTDPANIAKITGGALKVGIDIASGLSGTLIVIILTIYFTASLEVIKESAYALVPKSKRVTFAELTEKITSGVGKYLVGQIALAALNGFLVFVLLTIIGGNAPVVWAFVAFLLALIPLIGTVISCAVVSFSQLILAGPTTAIIVLVYFLIYMQIEAYVISPRVMNKAVSIPGSVVVIAALAGGTLLGVLGALIAIPIAASIILIIKEVAMPRLDKM